MFQKNSTTLREDISYVKYVDVIKNTSIRNWTVEERATRNIYRSLQFHVLLNGCRLYLQLACLSLSR